MLEAKSLDFSYDGLRPVLTSLDFALHPGEIVIVSGSTGSGKSTLAKCLSGFIPHLIQGVQAGSIAIGGDQYEDMKMSEIARRVALVQQDSENQICTLRVADEIAFGPENYMMEPEEILHEIPLYLKEVGAEHLATRTTYALSGGEKQRIAIASILACKPEYIIFDEPTSSLDPKGAILLREVIHELKQRNIGILIIEHNLDTLISLADRILTLTDGNLGPFQDNYTPPKLFTHDIPSYTQNSLLVAENLGFAYGQRRALDDVSVSIGPSEIVAIMGDNGSGKSTLLGLMAGLLSPHKGRITISGVPIEKMKRKEMGRKVAVVFQNPSHQIFERTVAKDQALAIDLLELGTEFEHKSDTALAEAGLSDDKEKNPFSLSHGQKRRLNVSATCFFNPDLYFLDEPFIGQDVEGRDFIIKRMQEIAKRGGAAILVTHNPRIAVNTCSRIIFMEKGSILLDGPPITVLDWLGKNGYHEYAISGGATG
ncbi:MAG: ATP-binding cassette domain-containing protein [Candidatus Thorarchaeota archaeon]|nr:ATP-binding cassette domain-containing protein [Candidatus Thorarchaeota archaeon]